MTLALSAFSVSSASDNVVFSPSKEATRAFYRIGDRRLLALLGMMRDVFCGTPEHGAAG